MLTANGLSVLTNTDPLTIYHTGLYAAGFPGLPIDVSICTECKSDSIWEIVVSQETWSYTTSGNGIVDTITPIWRGTCNNSSMEWVWDAIGIIGYSSLFGPGQTVYFTNGGDTISMSPPASNVAKLELTVCENDGEPCKCEKNIECCYDNKCVGLEIKLKPSDQEIKNFKLKYKRCCIDPNDQTYNDCKDIGPINIHYDPINGEAPTQQQITGGYYINTCLLYTSPSPRDS